MTSAKIKLCDDADKLIPYAGGAVQCLLLYLGMLEHYSIWPPRAGRVGALFYQSSSYSMSVSKAPTGVIE